MRCKLMLAALLWAGAATGASPTEVGVELNKLEPTAGGCRVYLLFENGDAEAFRSLKLDLVLFDRESVIARRVAVQGAPLAAGKTVLKVFDLADLPCTELGRVLLNDVLACETGGGERPACVDAVRTSSRTDIEFIK